MTTAWRLFSAALLAATALAGVPGTAGAAAPRETRLLSVQRVRDTVRLACATEGTDVVVCRVLHRPRPFLTPVLVAGPGVTTVPGPLGPLRRALRPRTPASSPAPP